MSQLIDAGAARRAANQSAVFAAGLIARAVGLTDDDPRRIQLLQEAELATKTACDMRTYSALIEADDFREA